MSRLLALRVKRFFESLHVSRGVDCKWIVR